MNIEYYDDIIIGGGKAGKTLAPALVAAAGRKTALVERSLAMIGGGCINITCIPTKTMVVSAEVAHTVRNIAAYGIKTNAPIVNLVEAICALLLRTMLTQTLYSLRYRKLHQSISRVTAATHSCLINARHAWSLKKCLFALITE